VLDTVTRSGKLTERERFAGAIEASLQFSKGGGRTVLTRQRIPYPFHATRPFYLDQARPDLATLYLQSAAGGLYRGDRVALSITAEPQSAAHVTTQAATIVHRTHRFPIDKARALRSATMPSWRRPPILWCSFPARRFPAPRRSRWPRAAVRS
jgi:urease accessory protein